MTGELPSGLVDAQRLQALGVRRLSAGSAISEAMYGHMLAMMREFVATGPRRYRQRRSRDRRRGAGADGAALISRPTPPGLHEAGSRGLLLSENPGIPTGARVKPTLNFHHLMRDHSLAVDLGRMTETDAATAVARAIQQTLACARVNFWNVSGPVGQRQMRRVTGYDGCAARVLSEPLVLQETTGEFFQRLYDSGCYVCPDTASDPLLREIFRTYLQPTQGLTMIVAAFYVDERVWGMISCVHDAARRWTAAEITALRKCASELSRRRAQVLDY